MMTHALHMLASAVMEVSAYHVEVLWTNMEITQQNVVENITEDLSKRQLMTPENKHTF